MDASFQTNRDDSKSQSSFVFFLIGGAISRKPSKWEMVANSMMKAEYITTSEAAKEVVWIKKFVFQLSVFPSAPSHLDL
jgi:hypothetical protein